MFLQFKLYELNTIRLRSSNCRNRMCSYSLNCRNVQVHYKYLRNLALSQLFQDQTLSYKIIKGLHIWITIFFGIMGLTGGCYIFSLSISLFSNYFSLQILCLLFTSISSSTSFTSQSITASTTKYYMLRSFEL